MPKRIVGIDLAIKGTHRASVYDAEAMAFLGKSFCFARSFDGFTAFLEKATDTAGDVEVLFIMEPTSGAWKPLSAFLMAKGYTVYLVKPQKVYDLRKFLKKHTKSDRIDSQTLAKLPVIDPEGIYPLTVPQTALVALDRYCRQRERIMRSISGRKVRIQALFTAVSPLLFECFGEHKFTLCSKAFLHRYADPFKVVKLGVKRLSTYLARHAFGTPAPSLAEHIYAASCSAVKIYREAQEQDVLPFCPDQFQDEINLELDLMAFEEKKVKELDKKIEVLYQQLDPGNVLKSIPGFGYVIAPSILGATGNPERFPNLRAYKSYCGLVPRKKQSATHDRKGLAITKSSQRILKKGYCMAAETARKYDPEAAMLYHRLIARGRHHYQAICAVGSNLAGRTFSVMKRTGLATQTAKLSTSKQSYVIRDFDGKSIDQTSAGKLIKERFPSKKERESAQQINGGSLSQQVGRTPQKMMELLSQPNYTMAKHNCKEKT